MTLRNIPLSTLRESATNPRKTFDAVQLDELTASVRQFGVLQPVIVRPLADEGSELAKNAGGPSYEIIAGARRFRAAQAAGLVEIPALVLQLDDRQTLEVQVIENLQRADLGVLEEARGFQLLHREHGYDVEQLAAKVGKSTSYVYQRMQLCALPPGALKLLDEGKLTAAQALLLVRIPNAERAEEAAEAIAEHHGDALSTQASRDLIQRDFMLQLKDAPFDLAAADLVPAAGSCGACPKRTSNQRTLFGEVDGPDLCTDGECFAAKVAAGFEISAAQARKAGVEVVPKNKLQGYDFVRLAEKCWDDPKTRTYAALLGGRRGAAGVEGRVLGQDHRGGAVWLLPRKDLREALRKAGHNFWARGEQKAPKETSDERKRKQQLAIDEAVREAERDAIRFAIVHEKNHDSLVDLLRLVVRHHAGHPCYRDDPVAKVWGDDLGDVTDFSPATRSFADLVAILVDYTLEGFEDTTDGEEERDADFRAQVGVDLAEIETAVRAKLEEQKPKPPKPKTKRPKAKKGKAAAAGEDCGA